MDGPSNKSHSEQQVSDRDEFETLVLRHYTSLMAIARHMIGDEDDARDMVQDVFAEMWMRWRTLSGIESPSAYLYRAIRNRTLNHLRLLKRRRGCYDRIGTESASHGYVIEEETNRLLIETIDKLPPRSGEVMRLLLTGMELSQIAETLGISVNTVKWTRADALRRIRQLVRFW